MTDRWTEADLGTQPSPTPESRPQFWWLVSAAIATVILWQIPVGNYILYPFSILATWFHEMGHGIAAMLLGGNFQKLLLYPNGSGLAYHSGANFLGPIGSALVSAGGPMGPPIAGAMLILASRNRQSTRYGLMILGAVLMLSTLIWVRSLFGIVIIPIMGLGILATALYTPTWFRAFAIQFLGVQACISTYHQLDYLFTYRVVIGGRAMLSDTGKMAQNLLLPHWFWGGLMAIAAAVILFQSLRIAYRSDEQPTL